MLPLLFEYVPHEMSRFQCRIYWMLKVTEPRPNKISLQICRSRVLEPMKWMHFSNLPNPSGRTRPWSVLSLWQKWVSGVEKWVERGRCLGLIKLPPSVRRLSIQCRILNIAQTYRPPRPVTGIALLYGDGVCFLWGTNWTVCTATSSQYLAVNCEPIV
jgi:hypothetical protein